MGVKAWVGLRSTFLSGGVVKKVFLSRKAALDWKYEEPDRRFLQEFELE